MKNIKVNKCYVMQKDRINPSYNLKRPDISKKGERRVVDLTFNPTEISSGQTLCVKLATLPINHVLIPGSRMLTFNLVNGYNESYHHPNLKSTLFKQITHKFNGKIYRDINEAHILRCYEDLWSKKDRSGKIDQGLGGSTNLAKLRSGDASGDNNVAGDALMNSIYGNRFIVPIDDDYLSENGAVYPYALLGTHETLLKVNTPDKVLSPGGSGKVVPTSFKLTNLNLRYETIQNEMLSEKIESIYNSGKSSYYSHATLVKTFPVSPGVTKIHENINLPRRSLRNIIMLFKRNTDDSESYYYPNLQSVKISFQGQPNYLYTQSLKKWDFFNEASRVFFPSDNTTDRKITQNDFYTNKFSLVIDFSSTYVKRIQGQGVKLTDTQSGVLLEITKLTGTTICTCYLYVVSDGLLNIINGQLESIQY